MRTSKYSHIFSASSGDVFSRGGVFVGFERILGIPILELSDICGDFKGESTGTPGNELSAVWGADYWDSLSLNYRTHQNQAN